MDFFSSWWFIILIGLFLLALLGLVLVMGIVALVALLRRRD
jgi:hypothetical protein